MADMIKFYKGLEASLPASGLNGALYITTDEGAIYLGTGTGMKRLGDFVQVANVAALPAKAHESCLYYCVAENILAKWNGEEWKQINKQPTAEELKTLLGLGTAAYTDATAYDAAGSADAVRTYVGEIPETAEATSIVGYIQEKTAGIATEGAMTELAGRVEAAEGEIDALQEASAKHVEKEEGKSLISDTEIARLAAMSDGANKVEASETNGNIKVDGEEVVVYTHPEKHTITEVDGLEDALLGKADESHDHAIADVQGLEDALSGKSDEGHTHYTDDIVDFEDALNTKADLYHIHSMTEIEELEEEFNNKADLYHTHGITDVEELQDALDAKQDVIPENTYDAYGSAEQALEDAKTYTDEKIAAIPAQTDYTVSITENTDDASVAKTYVFTQCGTEIGSIKLAKELVVTAGSVKEVTEADVPYAGAKVGEKYIELVIANQDAPIYVPAKDLVDIYTAKDGAAEVQVAISNTNEISATLVNGGITEAKLHTDVATKLNKVWEEVGVAEDLVDALANGQVKTNKEAIEAINNADTGILKKAKDYADGLAGNYDEAGAAEAAEQNAKDYADSLAGNYDTAGAADTAEQNAKDYADSLAENYEVAGAAYTAEQNAKDYADSLAENYDASGSAAEAEQNAKDYADGLAVNYDEAGAAEAAKEAAIADAAGKYETIGTAQGIVDALKLAETYEPIGAEGRAIAAAEGKVNALAGNVYTKEEVYTKTEVESLMSWGEF